MIKKGCRDISVLYNNLIFILNVEMYIIFNFLLNIIILSFNLISKKYE
jgi:hypothetical protein